MFRDAFARFAGLFLLVLVSVPAARAAGPDWALDVAGGQDHPLISRYANSWMIAYSHKAFEATDFPGKLGLDPKLNYLSPVEFEGRVTRMVYFAPLGKTVLEVQRNYEQALKVAGFKIKLSCSPKVNDCDKMRFPLEDRYTAMKEADFAANRDRQPDGSRMYEQMRHTGGVNMLGYEDNHFAYATAEVNGATTHVIVASGKVYRTDFTSTYIEIAEPKAMLGGQVTVDANVLKGRLQSEGKVALYGIYFDTGKAVLKPQSRAQLDEMAKLLKSQPAIKVYVVGHTDNAGGLDGNMTLSQQRAQAVVDALTGQYGIAPQRLLGRGVASLAPVAGNGDESGRARNRRVEMVLQ